MNFGHLWIYAFIPPDLQVTGAPISQRPHLPQGGPHAAGTIHDTRHRRQGCLVPLDGTLLPYNTITNIQLYISLNITLWVFFASSSVGRASDFKFKGCGFDPYSSDLATKLI